VLPLILGSCYRAARQELGQACLQVNQQGGGQPAQGYTPSLLHLHTMGKAVSHVLHTHITKTRRATMCADNHPQARMTVCKAVPT
jgi:hypothetical protein